MYTEGAAVDMSVVLWWYCDSILTKKTMRLRALTAIGANYRQNIPNFAGVSSYQNKSVFK
jgi:hypothetical protein